MENQEPKAEVTSLQDSFSVLLPDSAQIDHPITPRPIPISERDLMETTPNSMYNELFATSNDRFQDRNGPLIPLDQPRSGAGARLSFALSFSPTQKQSPTDPDFLRSPLYLGETPSAGSRAGYRISHYSGDGSADPLSPQAVSNGIDRLVDPNHYLYPHTPRLSTVSNQPLFDRYYYSPSASSASIERPLFPAAEESSGRLVRTPMVDEEIDYDSMSLRSKNELLQPPQLELRDEPKDPKESKESKESKNPTYSFAGPSAEESLPSVEESEKSGNLPSQADSPPDDDSFTEGSYDEESSDPSLPSTKRSEPAGNHSTVSRDSKKSLKRSGTAGVSETGNASEKAANYTPVSTTTHPCNCRKSRCLKLYCECFSSDVYCNGCNCIGCLNNLVSFDGNHHVQEHKKEREEAKQLLLQRNVNAFMPRVVADAQANRINLKGCSCRKTGCMKKYCECYQSGIPCGQNCRCQDCRNTPDNPIYEGKRVKAS